MRASALKIIDPLDESSSFDRAEKKLDDYLAQFPPDQREEALNTYMDKLEQERAALISKLGQQQPSKVA